MYQWGAPVNQSEPVYQFGDPVYQFSAPVYQFGAPVYQWGAPVYQCGAPVYQCGAPVYQSFCPCGMGVRIQPTPALRRVVRGDCLRDMSYPLPPAHCMQGLLACNGAYELG